MGEPLEAVGRGAHGAAPGAILRPAEEGEEVGLGPNRVAFVLGGTETGGRYSLTAWTMAPPPAPTPPVHIHEDADEAVYVVAGALTCQVGDRALAAGPGAVALVPRGTPHTLANPGPAPARFLVVLSPPGFEGYWRATARLLAAGGSPDPSEVLALQQRYQMASSGAARRFE